MEQSFCYCGSKEKTQNMIQCSICKNQFHMDCLKTGRPSSLEGDIFFSLTCANCAEEEDCQRLKLQWTQVVTLTLYNLQLKEAGKRGYFRWKEHICAFIDKHWNTLFGPLRKKTNTWYGTVAGSLSAGCPQHFCSGQQELKESGWWKLVQAKPPTLELDPNIRHNKRYRPDSKDTPVKVEGLRSRRGKPSFQAAMELKARRSMTLEAKEIRQSKKPESELGEDALMADSQCPEVIKSEPGIEASHGVAETLTGSAPPGQSEEEYLTEKDLKPGVSVPQLLLMEDDSDNSDLEIDPGSISPPQQTDVETEWMDVEEMLSALDGKDHPGIKSEVPDVEHDCKSTEIAESLNHEDNKEDMDEEGSEESSITEHNDADSTSSDSSDDERSDSSRSSVDGGRKPKRRRKHENVEITPKAPEPSYIPMSLYEEKQLLKKLNSLADTVQLDPELNRLKCKLRLRQLKREHGLPIFDLDATMAMLAGQVRNYPFSPGNNQTFSHLNPHHVPSSRHYAGDYRVLDRYHNSNYSLSGFSKQYSSFLTRLVGTEDDQLQSISSPYTARVLKPFIRRDVETISKKMKLYQEIIAYPHRNDPSWRPKPLSSIDYCYVRPQHIPSVNTLCREFFWPGIDLSECLQYPDFSCIVLYRKIVIAFAFMVPDVKYNEAYISFIFTHPEWRGCGIGTFMLYHLIQTCMGKDVTLHVSATNPAMVLYQRFGFKPEEFILDFYDKYYPEDSKDCKHAFLLRLKR